jgi:hypothetical protein
MRPKLPALFCFLVFALVFGRADSAVPVASDSEPVAAAAPFSRSAWIRAQKNRLRLDETPRGPRLVATAAFASAPARAPRGLANVRVSRDLLGDAAAPGQPETQTEAHLAIDPANEQVLLAGYQEGRFEDGGARTLTFAWSRDGGAKWTEGRVPGLTRDQGGFYERVSDPWVAFGTGGRAYFCSLAFDETTPANGIYVSASSDGGRSWGPPVEVHANSTSTNFDDKQSLVVDTRRDSPFRGRVYVGWDTVVANDRQVLRVAHSSDGALSFGAPVTVHSEANRGNIGIVMAIGPGGVVHAVWTHWIPATPGEWPRAILHTARSFDGGESWTTPQAIDDVLAGGVPGMRTGDIIASLAIDPRRGALYVAWMDRRFAVATDQVVLSSSTDGGQTWSAPVKVSDGPADAAAFTPAVAVNGRGQVGVLYYSLRNDPARNNWVDSYLAVSTNGGRSFRPSQRVSSRSFPASQGAQSRGAFLGDYQGLAAGRVLFRPLFVATLAASPAQGGRLQPDVFSAAVRP